MLSGLTSPPISSRTQPNTRRSEEEEYERSLTTGFDGAESRTDEASIEGRTEEINQDDIEGEQEEDEEEEEDEDTEPEVVEYTLKDRQDVSFFFSASFSIRRILIFFQIIRLLILNILSDYQFGKVHFTRRIVQ